MSKYVILICCTLLSVSVHATFEQKITPRMKRKNQAQATFIPKQKTPKKERRVKPPEVFAPVPLRRLSGQSAAAALEALLGAAEE